MDKRPDGVFRGRRQEARANLQLRPIRANCLTLELVTCRATSHRSGEGNGTGYGVDAGESCAEGYDEGEGHEKGKGYDATCLLSLFVFVCFPCVNYMFRAAPTTEKAQLPPPRFNTRAKFRFNEIGTRQVP